MSNVFARNRSPTGLEFWDNAVCIASEITRFVMNEKNVPKHWRFVYAFPIIKQAQKLRQHIVDANTRYPANEDEPEKRKESQQLAIQANENLIQMLQDMLSVLTDIDADKLDTIGEKLIRESALLRAWRKSAKVEEQR